LWTNVHLATMAPPHSYGEIRNAALAVHDGKIAWVGPLSDLPARTRANEQHDGAGGWITPGLIDCHTHIVYAGNRSEEFEARLNGATYADIAKSGGGILSTVRATRAATENELCRASLPRVKALLAEGVTTLEIKSGYGLELEAEAKMLRVARQFGRELPLTVRTTFLGAHTVPPEYAAHADDYVDELCERMLQELAKQGLVDAVDAFCESIAFSKSQTERVFQTAQRLGLPVKLHAEQLSDQGGTQLVTRYGGLSADHLEYVSADGIGAMARHGTVAVLLPGAFYFLRETRSPPVAALREAGVRMAVATDCNPGTSPLTSLLTAMNMACTLFRLTPHEALAGATINAAHALGLQTSVGSLQVGKNADFALWEIERPADLAYSIGFNPCRYVVQSGNVASGNASSSTSAAE
jgi:imidazolonepropionase